MATRTAKQPELTRPVTAADRPKDGFGIKVKVKTVDDANAAGRTLGFIEAHRNAVNAAREMALQAVHERFNAELVIRVDGSDEPIPYGEREEQLKAALEVFSEAEYPGEKTGTNKRSVQLDDVKLGWQKGRDSVVFATNKSANTCIDAIDKAVAAAYESEQRGLRARVAEFLDNTKITIEGVEYPIGLLIKLEPTIDRTRILDNFNAERVTRDVLARHGLKFEKGVDAFKATPNAYRPPDAV